MSKEHIPERRWFWATLALASVSIVGFVFAMRDLLESHFFRDPGYARLKLRPLSLW